MEAFSSAAHNFVPQSPKCLKLGVPVGESPPLVPTNFGCSPSNLTPPKPHRIAENGFFLTDTDSCQLSEGGGVEIDIVAGSIEANAKKAYLFCGVWGLGLRERIQSWWRPLEDAPPHAPQVSNILDVGGQSYGPLSRLPQLSALESNEGRWGQLPQWPTTLAPKVQNV